MRPGESLTTIVFVLLLSVVKSVRDFPGSYCSVKYPSGRCCTGRQDECNTPIDGTLCYCDDFCDRGIDDDCCPDFWSHCKKINVTTTSAPEEIRRCFSQGRYYNINATWKDNCNECKCIPMGRHVEAKCEEDQCLVHDRNNKFWGRKLREAKYFLGCDEPSEILKQMKPIRRIYDPNTLPREFDARKRWPDYISRVFDQDRCGACWAISVASVASDRFAIMSKGVEKVVLSAQHLLSCDDGHGQKGCEGRKTEKAWKYIKKYGLVDEACYPFTSGDGSVEKCKLQRNTTLKGAGCAPPPNPRRTEMYKVEPFYRLGNEAAIMYDIFTWGPVQAIMTVYMDLFNYRSGEVYRHDPSSTYDGPHSVRIIGWGEESSSAKSRKFWLVINSWGEDWGDKGLFKIEKGTNECEIEKYVVGVYPKTI